LQDSKPEKGLCKISLTSTCKKFYEPAEKNDFSMDIALSKDVEFVKIILGVMSRNSKTLTPIAAY
jgi:hypothetical protein